MNGNKSSNEMHDLNDEVVNSLLKEFVKEQIKRPDISLDNDWIGFNDFIDINIYTDDDGTLKAVAYPVVNGKTDTTVYKEIYLS